MGIKTGMFYSHHFYLRLYWGYNWSPQINKRYKRLEKNKQTICFCTYEHLSDHFTRKSEGLCKKKQMNKTTTKLTGPRIWQFLRRLNIHLLCDPAIPLLHIYLLILLMFLYLSNLYTHCGAQTHDPETKSHMLLQLS